MTQQRDEIPRVAFEQRRLSNGLRVVVAPDTLAPIVAVNLWYAVGSRHESPGKSGFAHLFEHLMFQGSRHVARAEHVGLVQGAGGAMNATTDYDRTNYFDTVPSSHLDLALWLEADRMATLLDAVNQETLDNQRDVVKNEKRQQYDNQPYGSFQERVMTALFPSGHPYHHTVIGSMADLDAATLADVQAFFQTYYVPANAVLSIAGDVDVEVAFRSAERFFGAIPAGARIAPASGPDLSERIGQEVRAVVPDAVPLERVHFGFRAPPFGTTEFDALEIATQILAGGKGSRLANRLVRRLQVAQDVVLFSQPLLEGRSALLGWATVRRGATAESVETAFWEELVRLASEPLDPADLSRAKALLNARELDTLQRVEDVADRLSMFTILFERPELVNEQPRRLLSTTAEAVQSVASEVFREDNRVVLTYVPQAVAA